MKTVKKVGLLAFLPLVLTLSCKQNKPENEVVVDATSAIEIPNISDSHFEMALDALGDNKLQQAAEALEKGKQGLIDESSKLDLTLYGKNKLDDIAYDLTAMADKLKAGENVDKTKLMETIMKGEIIVNHHYLITEDTMSYDPSSKSDTDNFIANMVLLEDKDKNIKTEKKSAANELYQEGKQLEKEYDEWIQKVKAHNAKTNGFVEEDIFLEAVPKN